MKTYLFGAESSKVARARNNTLIRKYEPAFAIFGVNIAGYAIVGVGGAILLELGSSGCSKRG